jgi:hypothetical protein
MDDHMIDRIGNEILQCFEWIEYEKQEGENIKDNINYKSAAALIKAYNSLVKLRYLPDYIKQNLKGSVAQEYKWYLESNS